MPYTCFYADQTYPSKIISINPNPIPNVIEIENSLAPLEKKMVLNGFVCLLRYCFDENPLQYKNRTIIHDKTFSFALFDISSHCRKFPSRQIASL